MQYPTADEGASDAKSQELVFAARGRQGGDGIIMMWTEVIPAVGVVDPLIHIYGGSYLLGPAQDLELIVLHLGLTYCATHTGYQEHHRYIYMTRLQHVLLFQGV